MAEVINVLASDTYVREYMKEQIKKAYPDMDVGDNSAFDDIFIKPMISLFAPVLSKLASIELKSNLKYYPAYSDAELDDFGENNFGVYRAKGTIATATQIFGFSKITSSGITIPQGTIVTTAGGLIFYVTTTVKYTREQAQSLFNVTTQAYEVVATISSSGVGTAYNVGENTITICNTNFSNNLIYTKNKTAAAGGTDSEDSATYVQRLLTYYVSQYLGTAPGYENMLKNLYPILSDVKVIGYRDDGMERDTIDVVSIDANGDVEFEEHDDGKYYAKIIQKHIGGCVDIYVRGSEYAVNDVTIPISSKIRVISGAAKDITLRNSETLNSISHDVKYLFDTDIEDDTCKASAVKFSTAIYESFDSDHTENKFNQYDPDLTFNIVAPTDESPLYGLKFPVYTGKRGAVYYSISPNADYCIIELDTAKSNVSYAKNHLEIYTSTASSLTASTTWTKVENLNMSVVDLDKMSVLSIILEGAFLPDNGLVMINVTDANCYLKTFAIGTSSSTLSTDIPESLNMTDILPDDEPYAVRSDISETKYVGDNIVHWANISDTEEAANAISSSGVVSRPDKTLDVTMRAMLIQDGALVSVSYKLKVKSKYSDTWDVSDTYSDDAAKTVIIVTDNITESVNAALAYKVYDADTGDQDMNESFSVGYTDNEVPAPVTGGVLSASYVVNEHTWTIEDYNDWRNQYALIFGGESTLPEISGAENTDIYDFYSAYSVYKKNLGLTQELISGSDNKNHIYDKYYIGSCQERAFVTIKSDYQAQLLGLPSTSDNPEINIRVPYNKTINEVKDVLYSRYNKIITADVLVKEGARKPVNVAIKIVTVGGESLSSTQKAQVQSVIESVFAMADIGGRIEQSDIVGALYTDSSTSQFVEYCSLPLYAFYSPNDISGESADTEIHTTDDDKKYNAGDIISAGASEYLYLNKCLIVNA